MGDSTDKTRKRYEDHLKDISELTCLINGPVHSSDECIVLGDFGPKYYKTRSTKDHRQDPETKKKFGRQQDNNTIVQHAVDKIIHQENKKIGLKDETNEKIDSEDYEDELYELDKTSLD